MLNITSTVTLRGTMEELTEAVNLLESNRLGTLVITRQRAKRNPEHLHKYGTPEGAARARKAVESKRRQDLEERVNLAVTALANRRMTTAELAEAIKVTPDVMRRVLLKSGRSFKNTGTSAYPIWEKRNG